VEQDDELTWAPPLRGAARPCAAGGGGLGDVELKLFMVFSFWGLSNSGLSMTNGGADKENLMERDVESLHCRKYKFLCSHSCCFILLCRVPLSNEYLFNIMANTLPIPNQLL